MQQQIEQIIGEISKVLLGKERQVKLAVACLLARGHLLIEDLPGMGKTTLAHALANVFGLSYNRIQFTSDLLPADILGVSVFDQRNASFEFHPGPIFAQLVLADEINRATPKSQSALLEAMEEGQVSIEGATRQLPEPFFVIATQNPQSSSGTYPLPESQLDRFLMRIELGYPAPEAERALFKGQDARVALKALKSQISATDLQAIATAVDAVQVSDAVLDYLQRLVADTRASEDFSVGLSPRGALGLLKAAKTWCMMDGREHLLPDDIQAVMPAVVGHRIRDGAKLNASGFGATEALVQRIMDRVDVLG